MISISLFFIWNMSSCRIYVKSMVRINWFKNIFLHKCGCHYYDKAGFSHILWQSYSFISFTFANAFLGKQLMSHLAHSISKIYLECKTNIISFFPFISLLPVPILKDWMLAHIFDRKHKIYYWNIRCIWQFLNIIIWHTGHISGTYNQIYFVKNGIGFSALTVVLSDNFWSAFCVFHAHF